MQLFEALEYADQGWPVLPLHTISNQRCACSKKDCNSPGKHPLTRRGLKDASVDRNQIVKWFDRWPEANVGILTGSQSGLIAVDIDPIHDGEKSFQQLLLNAGAELPITLEQKTGSGGRHILFKYPGTHIPCSVGRLGQGIDIRADGGYIVAPPSLHHSGNAYHWQTSPVETPLASMPDWLLNHLIKKGAVTSSERRDSQLVHEGHRNVYLTSFAGRLRREGKSRVNIEAALRTENNRICNPPLSHTEIQKIALSVSQYPMAPLHIWRDLVRSEQGPTSHTVRLVLLNLSFYMDAYGSNAIPSMEKQAHETGLSLRSVKRAIKFAEEDQWIYVEKGRYQGRAWKHNRYIPRIPDVVTLCP